MRIPLLLLLITNSLSLTTIPDRETSTTSLYDYEYEDLLDRDKEYMDCYAKGWHFMDKWQYHLKHNLGKLNSSLVDNCNDIVNNCPEDKKWISNTKYFHPFENSICPMVKAYIGPIDSCFAKIKPTLKKKKLIECTWKSIDFKNLTKDTPWIGPKDPRPEQKDTYQNSLDGYYACSSLYQECTYQLITDHCDPEVLDVLMRNRDAFEGFNCTYLEFYKLWEWTFFVEDALKRENQTHI